MNNHMKNARGSHRSDQGGAPPTPKDKNGEPHTTPRPPHHPDEKPSAPAK